jgi:ABC-type phosphate/phosphonate transport system substrate-binding protein
MAQLLSGKVFAAILPTPIVSREMSAGAPITVVLTTDPIPHIALSAAPALPAPVRDKIRQLVLAAHQSEDGRRMLAAIGFERFDPATAALYAGQGRILKDYWGY